VKMLLCLQGDSIAAQAVVTKSIADAATLAAAQKLAEVVLTESAVQNFGKSLGTLFSGRRLLDVSFIWLMLIAYI